MICKISFVLIVFLSCILSVRNFSFFFLWLGKTADYQSRPLTKITQFILEFLFHREIEYSNINKDSCINPVEVSHFPI